MKTIAPNCSFFKSWPGLRVCQGPHLTYGQVKERGQDSIGWIKDQGVHDIEEHEAWGHGL